MEKRSWFLPAMQTWNNQQWIAFDLGTEGKGCGVPAPPHNSFIFVSVSYYPSSTSEWESWSSHFTQEKTEVQGD